MIAYFVNMISTRLITATMQKKILMSIRVCHKYAHYKVPGPAHKFKTITRKGHSGPSWVEWEGDL